MSTSDSCCRQPQADTSKEQKCLESCKKDDMKKKTILFVPLDCVGHVNSLISVADSLKYLGHRTVFLFFDPMDGGLRERGHEVYDCTSEALTPSTPEPASEAKWNAIVEAMSPLWRQDELTNFIQTTRVGLGSMAKDIQRHNERVEQKIKLIEPDLVVIDHYFVTPALIRYGKPWARVYSATPLALHPYSDKLPPATLGLPTNWDPNEDRNFSWAATVRETMLEVYEPFNEWIKSQGLDPLPRDPVSFIHVSPWLNVYMYPRELDYTEKPLSESWTQLDSILRCNSRIDELCDEKTKPKKFPIPDNLITNDPTSKLVYLSMGSLASADLELMKRLVKICSHSKHRFIVNKGANHELYELADNMWGAKFLPQLEVLCTVDLIITHGGNNTITECLYFGVPGLIVCPMFSDQHDNAQRIQEKGLGRRVNPFTCTDAELLGAIDDVLTDNSVKTKMHEISKRMQEPESKYKAIEVFRKLVDSL